MKKKRAKKLNLNGMTHDQLEQWRDSLIAEHTPFSFPEEQDDWDAKAYSEFTAQSSINIKPKTKGENR